MSLQIIRKWSGPRWAGPWCDLHVARLALEMISLEVPPCRAAEILTLQYLTSCDFSESVLYNYYTTESFKPENCFLTFFLQNKTYITTTSLRGGGGGLRESPNIREMIWTKVSRMLVWYLTQLASEMISYKFSLCRAAEILTLQNLTSCDFSETSLFETSVIMFLNLSARAFYVLSSTEPQEPSVCVCVLYDLYATESFQFENCFLIFFA